MCVMLGYQHFVFLDSLPGPRACFTVASVGWYILSYYGYNGDILCGQGQLQFLGNERRQRIYTSCRYIFGPFVPQTEWCNSVSSE